MASRDYINITVRRDSIKLAQIYCVMEGITLIDYVSCLIDKDLAEFKEELRKLRRLKSI